MLSLKYELLVIVISQSGEETLLWYKRGRLTRGTAVWAAVKSLAASSFLMSPPAKFLLGLCPPKSVWAQVHRKQCIMMSSHDVSEVLSKLFLQRRPALQCLPLSINTSIVQRVKKPRSVDNGECGEVGKHPKLNSSDCEILDCCIHGHTGRDARDASRHSSGQSGSKKNRYRSMLMVGRPSPPAGNQILPLLYMLPQGRLEELGQLGSFHHSATVQGKGCAACSAIQIAEVSYALIPILQWL